MDLCDLNTIKKVMSRHGVTFSKALGQNFLINPEVCPAMAASLGADSKTGVLEIGAGVGVLTKELARVAGKVVCVELDKRLFPVLEETLADCSNVTLVNDDVMKLDLCAFLAAQFDGCERIMVCANLPYYITSPIIMLLLESRAPIEKIVVMVQREAGQRLCAAVGTREAGAVTVAVEYYAESEILFDVGRESFVPSPRVDSVVISLTPHSTPKYQVTNEKRFFTVVRAAFAQRRKTALNSLSNTLGVPKAEIAAVFEELGLDGSVRAEQLTMEELILIAEKL